MGPAPEGLARERRCAALPATGADDGRLASVIDAHAHLTDRRFINDLADVLDRARKAGVARILTAGEGAASSAAATALARRYDGLRDADGRHRHRAAARRSGSARRR